jgi:transcription elongation factor Elf1
MGHSHFLTMKCPDCKGQMEKKSIYSKKINQNVSYWVCQNCGSMYKGVIQTSTADDTPWLTDNHYNKQQRTSSQKNRKNAESPFYYLMWISGIILVIWHFVIILALWGDIQIDFGSNFEDFFNFLKYYLTTWSLLWIVYIGSSLLNLKERKNAEEMLFKVTDTYLNEE